MKHLNRSYYESFSTLTYKTCIKSKKPVIIDLVNHPIYGWGNNYVQIPISYIGYIVF